MNLSDTADGDTLGCVVNEVVVVVERLGFIMRFCTNSRWVGPPDEDGLNDDATGNVPAKILKPYDC